MTFLLLRYESGVDDYRHHSPFDAQSATKVRPQQAESDLGGMVAGMTDLLTIPREAAELPVGRSSAYELIARGEPGRQRCGRDGPPKTRRKPRAGKVPDGRTIELISVMGTDGLRRATAADIRRETARWPFIQATPAGVAEMLEAFRDLLFTPTYYDFLERVLELGQRARRRDMVMIMAM